MKTDIVYYSPVAVLGKHIGGGGWPLIIWEATTAKRNYYRKKLLTYCQKFRWVYRPTLETWRRAASPESARIEVPRGVGFLGGGVPLPSRLGDLGEHRELPSGVRGEAPAANSF